MNPGMPLLGIRGVKSFANEFSDVPEGSLAVGDDIEVNRPGVAEPRRGFPTVGGAFASGTAASRARKLYWWNGYILAHHDTGTIEYFDGNVWTAFAGTYPYPATNIRPAGTVANQSFYLSTGNGVYVLDSIATGLVAAGVPKAIDMSLASSVSAGTAQNSPSQLGYRHVWCRRDANGYLKVGAPSQRVVIISGIGNPIRDVKVTITIPNGIKAGDFVQVYRTANSVDNNTDPGDTEQLVYEYTPTNLEISAGTLTVTDVSPDSLRGAALYTNPDQPLGTIAGARLPPPVANAMAFFKGSMFYGATTQPNRLYFTLLAVGGTSGMQDGDELIIYYLNNSLEGGTNQVAIILTAKTTPSATTDFQLITGGTPAQNIDSTARNMVAKANAVFGTFGSLYAYYLSGPDDAPGKILFESSYLDVVAAYPRMQSSVDTPYLSPALPNLDGVTALSRTSNVVTATTQRVHSLLVGQTVSLLANTPDANFPSGTKTITVVVDSTHFKYAETGVNAAATSTFTVALRGGFDQNNVNLPNGAKTLTSIEKNSVYWSETLMPDSVPLRNALKLGSDDKSILAFIPLRDSLMIFKEDGLFKITGSSAQFTFEQVDTTLRLLGSELAVVLENQAFALTDQGVVAVPEQGAPKVVSFDIQDKLPTTTSTNLGAYGFVVAQESKREFRVAAIFSDPNNPTIPNEQWVYNAFTDSWARHRIYATAAAVSPTSDPTAPDFMYFGDGLANDVRRDVKSTSDFYNHYDNVSTASISSVNSTTSVTLSALPTSWTLAIGDAIEQNGQRSIITAISGNVLTLADVMVWNTGACVLYGAFQSDIQWVPLAQPSPALLKQFSEVLFAFRQAAYSTGTLNFWTELSYTQPLSFVGHAGVGLTPSAFALRVWPPQDAQLGTELNVKLSIRNALASWQLLGLTVVSSAFSTEADR